MILVSDDGKTFRLAYQHDRAYVFGFPDRKPLAVSLQGVPARYVRLQLPGEGYLHLDEVEVYAAGEKRNMALGQAGHAKQHQRLVGRAPAFDAAGLNAARPLATPSNAACDWPKIFAAAAWPSDDGNRRASKQSPTAQDSLAGRRADETSGEGFTSTPAGRCGELALRNPLLDFDAILFVKSAPGQFPHMSDQFYGWWSRPGGGVFVWRASEAGKTARDRPLCARSPGCGA